MDRPNLSICICTYKRPELLNRLLLELEKQETGGRFTFSIVVADNDRAQSAEATVSAFAARKSVPIRYCVQPEQNISLTRNCAIENSNGADIVFIDDDEFPAPRWLLTLFENAQKDDVDGVLGPVKCHFDVPPPKWVIKGKFHERATHPTGLVIDWTMGRTGNVLLKKHLFVGEKMPFSPDFHRAGDQDFFRRMIAKGYKFIWCNEAVAFEVVPPSRWTRGFMIKRALLRGTIGMQHPKQRMVRVGKALIAVPLYALALPFSLLLGQHRFMGLLIRLLDHSASLLAAVGLKPVKNQLLTD